MDIRNLEKHVDRIEKGNLPLEARRLVDKIQEKRRELSRRSIAGEYTAVVLQHIVTLAREIHRNRKHRLIGSALDRGATHIFVNTRGSHVYFVNVPERYKTRQYVPVGDVVRVPLFPKR